MSARIDSSIKRSRDRPPFQQDAKAIERQAEGDHQAAEEPTDGKRGYEE
jgi:hypothetical protein